MMKNGSVGIAAPSSGCPENALNQAEKYFSGKGFRVRSGKCVYANERFLSASDENRAAEINSFYKDDSVCAVFAARGGYGSARILPLIDYETARKNPKPLVGLSDTTALQNALLAKSGIISPTGCVLYRNDGVFMPPETERTLWDSLNGREQTFNDLKPVVSGNARGRIAGGCLSVFVSLLGTPYLPDLTDKILLLEDVGEQPYVIDRLLTHCALAGVFNQVRGVVFGQFHHCESKDENDGTIQDVLNDWQTKLSVPSVCGLNYGHRENSVVLPLGAWGELDAKQGVLHIEERAE